jgi:peptide deformylase
MEIHCNEPKYPKNANLLDIVIYPDPVLKKRAKEVTVFDQELKDLAQNMLLTMYNAPGIGLAAPQIGISKRIFVLDVDYSRDAMDEDEENFEISELNPIVFINPILKNFEGETVYQEGCLSIPGIFEDITRHKTLVVEYNDVEGNTHSMSADGLLSICIQHETDHLDGILFIEKLSALKLNFYRKKMIKYKKNV